MFIESFRMTFGAVTQIFILGAFGFVLVRKGIINQEGLSTISRLVVEVIFPILIFSRLVKNFSFQAYPHWWMMPLLSMAIMLVGFIIGGIFLAFIKGNTARHQFLSLIAFQNSGYLPLALVAAILPPDKANVMFIDIFMLLLGFDMAVWSLGIYLLTFHAAKRFELGSIFSPPVIANLFSLALIFFGLNKFLPNTLMQPLNMIGDCTLPLAMFVVGGNIAAIHLTRVNKKAILLMTLAKLIILPALGFLFVLRPPITPLMGLLIIMQLAMPPATSLSLIIRHYKKEDILISQGVFFGHILSLITIPVFLSLYFSLVVIK